MKSIILLLFSFLVLFSCASKSNIKAQSNKNVYETEATYTPYLTAMGKGKGIIFRVEFLNNKAANITVDSFIVNNKSLPFILKNNDNFIEIESNYLKSKKAPSFSDDSKSGIIKEIEDPIIINQNFYPSWIIITINNEKIKLIIENYKNTQ
ncbi:MAG: hypothetical protein ACOYMA_11745 [Bacteroidia bacterium]